MSFVPDASVAMAWYFLDEQNDSAAKWSELAGREGIVVPEHWALEVANAILMGERRERSTSEQTAELFERLSTITIEIDERDRSDVFDVVLPLAREHGLTVYDAIYLELAARRGLPLASFDAVLNAAAATAGVARLGVG